MFLIVSRHASGPLHQRQVSRPGLFCHLNASLNIANGVQILGKFGAVAGTEISSEAGDLLSGDVQNAAVFLNAAETFCLVSAVALSKEAFEYPARIVLGGGAVSWGCARRSY